MGKTTQGEFYEKVGNSLDQPGRCDRRKVTVSSGGTLKKHKEGLVGPTGKTNKRKVSGTLPRNGGPKKPKDV